MASQGHGHVWSYSSSVAGTAFDSIACIVRAGISYQGLAGWLQAPHRDKPSPVSGLESGFPPEGSPLLEETMLASDQSLCIRSVM